MNQREPQPANSSDDEDIEIADECDDILNSRLIPEKTPAQPQSP